MRVSNIFLCVNGQSMTTATGTPTDVMEANDLEPTDVMEAKYLEPTDVMEANDLEPTDVMVTFTGTPTYKIESTEVMVTTPSYFGGSTEKHVTHPPYPGIYHSRTLMHEYRK